MPDKNIYGYVNGKPVYSRDEFIFESRYSRYKDESLKEQITNDAELLKFAEKVTSGWLNAGHKQSFTHFYLSDYALSEPYRSLTLKEFERLKQLQENAYAEWEAEQAKYKYENFEGRPMTETEIRMFLDRHVKEVEDRWGETNFYSEQAREHRDRIISKFRAGEVVPVDSYEYNAKYGNGTGAYERTLYSDGTIRDGCYGYLD